MSAKPNILVVGSSNTDLVIFCDRLPNPGETVLGGHFQMFGGGKGANRRLQLRGRVHTSLFLERTARMPLGQQHENGFLRKESTSTTSSASKVPQAVSLLFLWMARLART